MNNLYNIHFSKLIDSVTHNFTVNKTKVTLIKHYNSLNLVPEVVDECFRDKKDIKCVYYEFDGSVMADPYEPFLSTIKDVLSENYDLTIDEFLDECGVYKLHRSVIKSYFETGICKRTDEVIVSEYQYECEQMKKNIDNMLEYISSKQKIVFVFNRLNNVNESTLRILLGMINNEKYHNISIIATYNEMYNIPDYIAGLWEEYTNYLIENDSIIEWSFNENQIDADFKHDFVFSVENVPEYMKKLRNMYHLMAIHQADYYASLINKKIKIEKLNIPERYAFDFMEIYAEISLILNMYSDAMIYAESMKTMNAPDIVDKEFRYKYLLSQIYMLSDSEDKSKKAALECYAIAEKQGDEFAMFRAELAHFVAGYSGWKKTVFLEIHPELPNVLLDKARKYGYYNQLAHIYMLAFDNKNEQFTDVDNLEENLQCFNIGMDYAKSLGNECLLAAGYKKNVMIASINGRFNISNYYYELLTEVDLIKNNNYEIGGIYNGLGYNNCTAENFEKSNEYYNKALIIFDKINEIELVGETLYNMAINAMLANEHGIASEYLEMCINIVKVIKRDSLRICNFSKLSGLLTLCYYRMGNVYSSKMYLQSLIQFLDHVFTTDVKAERNGDFYLWDDDLFLCHYSYALILMDDERYEEALDEFNIAEKYIVASSGFRFFSVPQYCMDKAKLYRYMGKNDEAEKILDTCKQFCDEKGYAVKSKMVSMCRNESDAEPMKWDLSLKGITLKQIESNIKALAIQYLCTRQKHNMEFLSIWQKTAESYSDSPENLIETSIKTFTKFFNMDYALFVRYDNGVLVTKYDDSPNGIQKEQIDYVLNFFTDNRKEVITSRTDNNYYEYRDLINNVLCSDRISFAMFIPIYNNEKLDSIFITYSILKESWNSVSSKMVCDKEELPIFMFFFRELLSSIDRLKDKSEISKMNKKLQEANVSLSQLAKKADAANHAKTDFLAKMSHEIRTPINAIIGMNEMVLRESKESEIHKYAYDIKSSANTLLSIINEILDASKIESGKLEIIPVAYEVSNLFHDIYNMINLRTQKKGLELVFDIDKNMPSELFGDDIRLRQILVNLMTNAVKYTHKGTVTLVVRSEIKGDKTLLNFKVKDTGIGIKEEDIHKLFVKFERIEESRNRNIEGTGLGMNITQQLLMLMGSKLEVESEYGIGSEFSFSIEQGITNVEPLGDFNNRIEQMANEYNYVLSYIAPKAKLLVVDDNEINRKVVKSLLKKSQIHISEADNGMSCIEMLKEDKFDIILLDYMMPIMDGVETLNAIRNQHLCDDVPVIMLTANAVVGAKEQFLSAGFDDYLSKPIEPEKLDKLILEYLPKELVIEGEIQEEIVDKSEDNYLPAMDEFDFSYALNILKDKEILMSTLKDFYKVLGVLPEKLNDYYINLDDSEKLNLYKIEVHALKSSSALVGAMILSKLARLLEVAAIENDIDRIIVLHPILIDEMSKHKIRLSDVFPEDSEDKIEIEDKELVLGYFDMIQMAALSYDYNTADFVCKEIKKYRFPDNICKYVDELLENVNNLDFDEAVQLVEIIKGNW